MYTVDNLGSLRPCITVWGVSKKVQIICFYFLLFLNPYCCCVVILYNSLFTKVPQIVEVLNLKIPLLIINSVCYFFMSEYTVSCHDVYQ